MHETLKNNRKHTIKGNMHQVTAKKLIMSHSSSLDKICGYRAEKEVWRYLQPSRSVLSNLFGLAGHKVERRRREDRSAKGTDGVGCGEGCPPVHCSTGGGVWRGDSAPSQKSFRFLGSTP